MPPAGYKAAHGEVFLQEEVLLVEAVRADLVDLAVAPLAVAVQEEDGS